MESGTIPEKATAKLKGLLTSTPTLPDLLLYFEEVAKWDAVCPFLLKDDTGSKTTTISNNNHGNVARCRREMLEMFLREISNPTWHDVVNALRRGKYNNLADRIEEPKSASFLQKYLKAKHDLGSEELKLLKILFFGPPGAGKTTLLSVLLGKDIQSPRESTGVLDRKLVQFKVAVQRNVEKEISQWKIVSINDEISRLRHTIEKILEKRASEHDNDDLKSDLQIDDILAKDMIPDSENDDQTDQQQYIASNTLMACYDSGGQPEFFDVMPAFISATTGNIMIFDMSKDLNSPLDPEFYKNGQLQKLSDVKTHYTGTELLKTALANIQSHAAKYSSSTQVSCLGSNRLLVVGTHLDQCGRTEDEVKGRLQLMEQIICKDVLHGCSTISVMKRSRGKNIRNVYPIASKCDVSNDEAVKNREVVAQEIRTAIENMSESEDVAKEVPISWLLFQYELKLHNTPCILRSDCDQIADKCYIQRKDIDDILLFFHELGILLYYKDKSGKLSQVVFSEPQWLFAQLTRVIQLKYDPSYETEGSIKKGIFKKQFLKELYGKEFDSNLKGISLYDYIIDLFVHLNIMASLSDVTEKYFMPALLNPVPNVNSIDELFGDEVCSTLCVKFKDGFFPRGMFCCLIALCVKRNRYWKLQPDSAYKDLVVFQIDGNEEYLILSDKIHYISVEIHRKEVLQQNKHQVLFCVLYDNLKEVCNTIHLDGEFTFGFLCKKENCKQFASVQHPYSPEKLLCSVCDYNPTMTYDQLVWFISHKVLDICNKSKSPKPSSNATGSGSPDHGSLLAQEPQMYELTEIIIPKIITHWKQLAYRMRYSFRDVEAFDKGGRDLHERCEKLFVNWLETGHGPTPKTYQTLLVYIKKVGKLTTASEEIESELITALLDQ